MAYGLTQSQAYVDLCKLALHMSFGKLLREAREKLGYTQDQVGAFFDPPLAREAVSNWERDVNLPEAERLPVLSRRLRIGLDILFDTGNTYAGPDVNKVPLISWVQAGNFAAVVDNLQPGDAEEWIPTTVPVRRHTYALRVRGESMTNPNGEPTFPSGCVIIVEPDAIDTLDKLASSPVSSFVIVKRMGDDEATFKQLVRDNGKYYLKPLNPQYPMIELREGDVLCGVVRDKPNRLF